MLDRIYIHKLASNYLNGESLIASDRNHSTLHDHAVIRDFA